MDTARLGCPKKVRGNPTARTSSRRTQRFSPEIQEFEQRVVPASYRWDPTGGNFPTTYAALWSNANNWDVLQNGVYVAQPNNTATYPSTATDDVLFDGNLTPPQNQPWSCLLNLTVTVDNVIITNGFQFSVGIAAGIQLNVQGTLAFDAPSAQLGGQLYNFANPPHQDIGTININTASGNFAWTAGDLHDVALYINSYHDANNPNNSWNASGQVSGSGVKEFEGANIAVNGQFFWTSGSVTTGPSNSSITVGQSGTFTVSADGATWGRPPSV